MTNEELEDTIVSLLDEIQDMGISYRQTCNTKGGVDSRICPVSNIEIAAELISSGWVNMEIKHAVPNSDLEYRAKVAEMALKNVVRDRNYLAAQIYLGAENDGALTVDYYLKRAEKELSGGGE